MNIDIEATNHRTFIRMAVDWLYLVYILSITTIVGVIVGIREIIVDVAEQSSNSPPYLPIRYLLIKLQALTYLLGI